jgi:hypothetical protein
MNIETKMNYSMSRQVYVGHDNHISIDLSPIFDNILEIKENDKEYKYIQLHVSPMGALNVAHEIILQIKKITQDDIFTDVINKFDKIFNETCETIGHDFKYYFEGEIPKRQCQYCGKTETANLNWENNNHEI